MVEMQASLVLMLSVIHMSTRQSYWSYMPLSTQNHSSRVVPATEAQEPFEAVSSVQANYLNGDHIASDTAQARSRFVRHTS